jgi:sRNA-binding protein
MKPETKRGLAEGRQHLEALRARWPQAFPARGVDVRPLATGVTPIVAAEMGWSWAYARGVMMNWKAGKPYCDAILRHATRIALDGSPSGETVDDEARAMARERVEGHKARQERKAREAVDGPAAPPTAPAPERIPEPPVETALVPPVAPKRGDGFAALRQAHRNRIAAG